MKSVKNEVVTEIEINKSVFINYLVPVDSVEVAKTKLQQLRSKYPDANHHCYAYIIGENQEVQKYSDDGEPSKTAGMPIMEVLKKHNLTNILNVSIRYFGGIKLGAGGLVRAYSKSCASGILECDFSELTDFLDLEITVPFDEIGKVEKFIRDSYDLTNTTYDQSVHYFVTLLKDSYQQFYDSITEKTSGRGIIKQIKEFKKYI